RMDGKWWSRGAASAARAVGTGRRGEFDRGYAGRMAGAAPFGAAGRVAAGFWWRSGRAEEFTKLRKRAADAIGSKAAGWQRAFPGQPLVGHDRPGEAQLGVGKHDQ